MIPKIIHYCWFGKNPLPTSIIENINSWKKCNPDYKIIQWNENNFEVEKYPFIKKAYDQRAFAFASDMARLVVIYRFGGFYLDTDVEALKSFNNLRTCKVLMGLEDSDAINTGLMLGAVKGQKAIASLIHIYEKKGENIANINITDETCVTITTKFFKKRGFQYRNVKQNIAGVDIFPTEFFCPKPYGSSTLKVTSDTYTIHHYSGTWLASKDAKKRMRHVKMGYCIKHIIGVELYDFLYSKYKKLKTNSKTSRHN